MKPFYLLAFTLLLISLNPVYAQTYSSAGAYMSFISNQYREVTKDYWSYAAAVAHGKSARKVENRRQSLIQTVKDSQKKITAMPGWENDNSLRDSAKNFLQNSYHVLNDDYGKIVNMEDVAEQSYDGMEAYLLAQDLANQKLDKALISLAATQKEFAEKYKVTILDNSNDELSGKVKTSNKVNAYYKVFYLLFFKSYKQEAYMLDALNSKNINGIEQNKTTLLKYSTEGIVKLDTAKAFNGDRSLITACKQMLDFYKKECDKTSTYISYFLKAENFDKTKKAFEAKKQSDRTKEDVENFNASVNELNKASNEFNTVNAELNQTRKTLLENWNKAVQNFLDKHTPKYR